MPQCSLGTGPAPKLFRAGGCGHCSGGWVDAGNRGPIPQCLPGTTPRPGACWGRAATPPHGATLFAPQWSLPGRSPGQPAARGSAGALLLLTHSLLRPRGRHRDFCLHAPQYTADRLGPGPSPESRPVGPAVGHSGTWSPPARPPPCVSSSRGAIRPTSLRAARPRRQRRLLGGADPCTVAP